MPAVCPPPPDYVPILNARTARPAKDRPLLDCLARVEWATGVEVMRVQAVRYDPTDGSVFVYLPDRRCRFVGAWLSRADVQF